MSAASFGQLCRALRGHGAVNQVALRRVVPSQVGVQNPTSAGAGFRNRMAEIRRRCVTDQCRDPSCAAADLVPAQQYRYRWVRTTKLLRPAVTGVSWVNRAPSRSCSARSQLACRARTARRCRRTARIATDRTVLYLFMPFLCLRAVQRNCVPRQVQRMHRERDRARLPTRSPAPSTCHHGRPRRRSLFRDHHAVHGQIPRQRHRDGVANGQLVRGHILPSPPAGPSVPLGRHQGLLPAQAAGAACRCKRVLCGRRPLGLGVVPGRTYDAVDDLAPHRVRGNRDHLQVRGRCDLDGSDVARGLRGRRPAVRGVIHDGAARVLVLHPHRNGGRNRYPGFTESLGVAAIGRPVDARIRILQPPADWLA